MLKFTFYIIFNLLFLYIYVFQTSLFSVENTVNLPALSENNTDENGEKSEKTKNINLDLNALYGIQYNQMFSGFSISQEKDTFVYLLSSNFNRSADFGYNDKVFVNSGFYENTAELTVNWNLPSTKIVVEAGADNKSHGMFDNDVFSREEKGNNKLSEKTTWSLNPSTEVFVALGGAWYKHSLIAIDPSELQKSRVLKGDAEVGGEYVWSSSNRMRLNASGLYYDYTPSEVESDRHFKAEIIDDFSYTRNIGISIGVGYVMNRNYKDSVIPVTYGATLSFKGYKYFNSTFIYKYDITPFQPEEFYLKQKYINPIYNLPPGMVHTGEIKSDLKLNSVLNFRVNLKVEKNKYYYNYFPTFGNVLSANTLNAVVYDAGTEASISLNKGIWVISLGYNYFYFTAGKNITYEPDHDASASIKYNGKYWKLDWTNSMRGRVFVNPDNNEKLPAAFIGSLGIQRRILEGSYFYGKIENLYNNKYSLRKGYPEPGISYLAGLRILL